MPGKLKEKANRRALTPQETYKSRRGSKAQDLDSIGPKEQTIKLDQTINRGGKEGTAIGNNKLKKISTTRKIKPRDR